jgi:hypothetical protein
MMADPIDVLDDRAVVLAVQYLAESLQGDEPTLVLTENEARLVIATLLAETRVAKTEPGDLLPTELDALTAARRALAAASADLDAKEATAELLAEPPTDEQMAVEAALTSVAVLALLISWLQTKVELRVRRKGGKTEVDFTISKQAANAQTLRAIADTGSVTDAEVWAMIDSLGDVAGALSGKHPDKLAALYEELRLDIRYDNEKEAIDVMASPRVNSECVRGGTRTRKRCRRARGTRSCVKVTPVLWRSLRGRSRAFRQANSVKFTAADSTVCYTWRCSRLTRTAAPASVDVAAK